MKHISHVENQKTNLFWTIVRYLRYLTSYICIHIVKSKDARPKRNKVAICSIFKNEAVFLKEWLEYHLLIGVEHFYLYNNFSDDNYQEILKPYIEKGVVTLIEWPMQYGQLPAYEDCYKRFKEETQWIAYIDLDEFICLKHEINIQQWIQKYDKYPSIFVYWKFFGTSGLLEHNPNQLVMEQYTASWPALVNSGKSFINTAYDFKKFSCHLFYPIINILGVRIELLPINEFKRFVHYWIVRSPYRANSQIQINHYYTRSYAQYLYKTRSRGDACSAGSQQVREIEGQFERHESMNTDRDYSIQRFLVLLKLRMRS